MHGMAQGQWPSCEQCVAGGRAGCSGTFAMESDVISSRQDRRQWGWCSGCFGLHWWLCEVAQACEVCWPHGLQQ